MKNMYPLLILMVTLSLLNILDYLTTVYALQNIPGAYELNPLLQEPSAIFKFKILLGTPLGIAGILASLCLEKMKSQYTVLVKFPYYTLLVAASALVVKYVFVVSNNLALISYLTR